MYLYPPKVSYCIQYKNKSLDKNVVRDYVFKRWIKKKKYKQEYACSELVVIYLHQKAF